MSKVIRTRGKDNRRQFLAAAAAPVALVIAPAGGAGEQPAPCICPGDWMDAATESAQPPGAPGQPAAWLYAEMEPVGAELWPVHVYATRAEAVEHARSSRPPRVRRYPYVPLACERRFRVVSTEWCPELERTGDRAEDDRRFDAGCAGYRDFPTSYLEVPEKPFWTERYHGAEDLVTRAEGLAEVARLNRQAVAERVDDPRGMLFCEWHCLVELGQPFATPIVSVEVSANGLGREEWRIQYPVRLVRPTPNELAEEAVSRRSTMATLA